MPPRATVAAAAPGDAPRSHVHSTLLIVAGTSAFHLAQLGVVVLINKFATPDVVGHYFFAMAIAFPLLLLCGLELRAALVADGARQFTVGTYLRLRSLGVTVAGLALAAVLVWHWSAHRDPAALLILGGAFAARLAWSLGEVGWGTYQLRERLDLMALSYFLRGLVVIGPFAILLPLAEPLGLATPEQRAAVAIAALWLNATGMLAVHVLFDRPRIVRRGGWDLGHTWRAVRGLALQTLPLGLVALIINLCDSLPRWLFASPLVTDGHAQLGYFGSLVYVTIAGNLLVTQIATASANRLARSYAESLPRFLRLTMRLVVVALLIAAGMLALAFFVPRTLLRLLYTPDYVQFAPEFRLIIAGHALALLTNILGIAITQMRLYWVQVPAQVVTLVATVVAALVLIPGPQPVHGAAATTVVRAVTQFAVYAPCFLLGVYARARRGTAS